MPGGGLSTTQRVTALQAEVDFRRGTRAASPRTLRAYTGSAPGASGLGGAVAVGRGFVVVGELLVAGKVSRQLIGADRWLLDGFVVRACFGHGSTVELGARPRPRG